LSLPLSKVDEWGVVWKGVLLGTLDYKGVIWNASWTKTSIWPGDRLTYDDGDNVGVYAWHLRFAKEFFLNLKFGGGFKGTITTNKGLVHLNKKPHNGLETPSKG